IGLVGGANLYAYANGNPLAGIDPTGLDAYLVNREIGGSEVRSKYNPLTHTFVAVQHPDGSVSTYGWGTTYNDQKQGLWGTEVQNEWDRLTAAEAIRQGKARRVGGSDLDPYVPGAYKDISKDPTSFHRWLLWNNCKNEARDLIRRAKRLQKSDTSGDNECAK
ncbi:MAG: hypothetical protein QME66_13965, partial [Candidatus Eisenbacteria bacterium]|nr:hypothetical protein [Candidatus Eisenbacteria bacterium]